MKEIVIVANNIRSTHNIGAIFRTAEGFGVSKIIICGYTPYPKHIDDTRLPHIAEKLHSQIHKTALGAESIVPFYQQDEVDLKALKDAGYTVVALEQSSRSVDIGSYKSPDKIALVIGEEVDGIEQSILDQCDDVVEIPMTGKKESFNVSVATGIALYALSST